MGVPFNKEGKGPYIVKECVVAVVGGGGLIHFFCGRGMMNANKLSRVDAQASLIISVATYISRDDDR